VRFVTRCTQMIIVHCTHECCSLSAALGNCRGESLGRISPPGALRTGREAVASSGSHCPAASVERTPASESARLSSRHAVEPMAIRPPAPSQRLQRPVDQNEVDVACQKGLPKKLPEWASFKIPDLLVERAMRRSDLIRMQKIADDTIAAIDRRDVISRRDRAPRRVSRRCPRGPACTPARRSSATAACKSSAPRSMSADRQRRTTCERF